MLTTLILNVDAQPISLLPLSTISWKYAIKEYYKGVLDIIEYYDDIIIHSPSVSINLPAVVMLKNYIKFSRNVRFTRENLFLRDNYECQYCGTIFHKKNHLLTFDHITPKSKGGQTTWKNVTTSCFKCNISKGSHYCHEIGMFPKNKATVPTYYHLINNLKKQFLEIPHESWLNYILCDEKKIIYKKPNIENILKNNS